jgi:hypothetical protein
MNPESHSNSINCEKGDRALGKGVGNVFAGSGRGSVTTETARSGKGSALNTIEEGQQCF